MKIEATTNVCRPARSARGAQINACAPPTAQVGMDNAQGNMYGTGWGAPLVDTDASGPSASQEPELWSGLPGSSHLTLYYLPSTAPWARGQCHAKEGPSWGSAWSLCTI